ncbi:MAG: 23S rRNA (adenine(2030)-N(6))-methyltransferase RlmJ [Proteobacteria bacterium]|nr:23S rRNA (adenine(2030)-N(6))-methyltransferase RlmJ [Pseudomonadota bacterium]
MNYRHAFHAGNFADVLKHAALMRVLTHLRMKETPFRVIDTHAGAGMYDLSGDEASRTGEWREGIALLTDDPLDGPAEAVLAPYRAALAALCPGPKTYPGSPALIRHALRAQDRASFNELHPGTCVLLRRAMGRDSHLVINEMDGYMAWKAQVPPPERRGLVLVDPPFEKEDEFDRMSAHLAMMARKWPTGTAMLWYPIKNLAAVARFEAAIRESGFSKLLILELHVDRAEDEGPLAACGLAIANAPWKLAEEMQLLLPALAERLARGDVARWRVDPVLEG